MVLGLVMEYLGKSEKAIVYSLQQMDFLAILTYGYSALHAKHCAVIAWQQMRGTIGTHFPQQFPLLGSAFNNLSLRLHIGFMHITVAQYLVLVDTGSGGSPFFGSACFLR